MPHSPRSARADLRSPIVRSSLAFALLAVALSTVGCHPKRAAKAPERQPIAEALGGKCGKISSTELAEAPMLDGRIKIRAPKGADDAPRAHGVMDAPRPSAEESRLKTDVEGQSLAIVAEELFQLDPEKAELESDALVKPKSLADEAASYFKAVYPDAGELEVSPLAIKQGEVRAIMARPKEVKVAPGADAALVLSVLVSLPDATLQRVSFHVTPGLVAEAGCTKYAEYLAKTLAVGERKLARAAGTQTLEGLGQKLRVEVPKGYTMVKQPGPDFDTWRFTKLRTLGNYQGSMALSIDAHPDTSQGKRGKDKLKRKLLGRKVEWRGERNAKGGFLIATARLGTLPATGDDAAPGKGRRSGAKGRAVYAQVALKALREGKYLDELLNIAASVTKRK